jgi:release factor glutamine methyltransferase
VTVGEAVRTAEKALDDAGVPTPRADAEILTAAALGTRRSDLFLRANENLPLPAIEKLKDWVSRRVGREPVQLILGYAPFLDLEITVEPGVFVPRPETEGLAELCAGLVQGVSNPVLVEACAGTAPVALWFLRNRPESDVVVVERNPKAINCALKTARRYDLDLKVVRGDLLEPFIDGHLKGTVDIVVANPPYVHSSNIETLPPEVRDWELRESLDGGPKGLDFYPPLTQAAVSLLAPGGWLAFEVGEGAAPAVVRIIELNGGFDTLATGRDLGGVERYVYARENQDIL